MTTEKDDDMAATWANQITAKARCVPNDDALFEVTLRMRVWQGRKVIDALTEAKYDGVSHVVAGILRQSISPLVDTLQNGEWRKV